MLVSINFSLIFHHFEVFVGVQIKKVTKKILVAVLRHSGHLYPLTLLPLLKGVCYSHFVKGAISICF